MDRLSSPILALEIHPLVHASEVGMTLFTIGHSNHSIEAFIELLQSHGVTALADVRSHPYSRYLPHFIKAQLQKTLPAADIKYVFLGQELGARPQDPVCYDDNGKARYENIAATPAFSSGIQRLLKGVADHTIALMCAEQDPITCHRAILICPQLCQHLSELGVDINHILKDGGLETHRQLEERLLKRHGLQQPGAGEGAAQLNLFGALLAESPSPPLPRKDLIKQAYKLQAEQIAYVEKPIGDHAQID